MLDPISIHRMYLLPFGLAIRCECDHKNQFSPEVSLLHRIALNFTSLPTSLFYLTNSSIQRFQPPPSQPQLHRTATPHLHNIIKCCYLLLFRVPLIRSLGTVSRTNCYYTFPFRVLIRSPPPCLYLLPGRQLDFNCR